MYARRIRNLVARSLIAALLFTQGALALAACDWARPAPALALAQAEQGNSDCMQQIQNVNLCVAHCLAENQSLDKPSAALPVLPPAPILTLHHFALKPRSGVRIADLPVACAGPPLRILYRSFLI